MALKTYPLTMDEVAVLCKNAGFVGENLITAMAVIWGESGGNAWAVHINDSPGRVTHGSMDLGLAQFNTYWWSTHSANNLMKPEYSINLMFRASKGSNFMYWMAYINGFYKKFLPYAESTVLALGL